jgi:hypothetical protein
MITVSRMDAAVVTSRRWAHDEGWNRMAGGKQGPTGVVPDDDNDLADVADSGLSDIPDHEGGPQQPSLEGTDYTKVKFVGVNYDSPETEPLKLGDEMTFKFRGRVVALGDELMKDSHQRHVAKIDVNSVVLLENEA